MLELATKTPLEVWYTRMDIDREVMRVDDIKLRDKLLSKLVKAQKELAADINFPHLAVTQGGAAHIEDRPPLNHFDAISEKSQKIHANAAFSNYRRSLLPERRALVERYTLRDLAMKVVGVGSVGTLCAIGLFMTPHEEPLFLQVKEALCPVLEKIVPPPEGLRQQGNRVVKGQRNMQAASHVFFGWAEDPKTKRQFYVRRLKNRVPAD
jgi:uncharacterized protein (DUF2252 family)